MHSIVLNPATLELLLWIYKSIVIYILLTVSALTPTVAIVMAFIVGKKYVAEASRTLSRWWEQEHESYE